LEQHGLGSNIKQCDVNHGLAATCITAAEHDAASTFRER
jgi:hypothetical protein